MKSISFPLVLVLIVAGCAGGRIAPSTSEMREHIFQSNFGTIWQAVIEVLNRREVPIKTMDKTNSAIVTDFVMADTADLSILFPATASDFPKQGRYRLTIWVTPLGDQTRVRIDAQFERFSSTIDERLLGEKLPTWKPQKSVGALESEIFNETQKVISNKDRRPEPPEPSG